MPSSRPEGEGNTDPAFDIGDLGELWSWGVDTSRAMSERVLEMYRDLGSSAEVSRDVESELRHVRLDLERLADLTVDVFDRLLTVVGRVVKETNDPKAERDGIALQASAGETASAEGWVHNISTEERPAPRLLCTDLATADGSQIPSSRIRLDLAVAPIAAANSRKFLLVVDVPAMSPQGVYHGLLISNASSDSVMSVRVEVMDPGATRVEASAEG
jgi:hypothetical protein